MAWSYTGILLFVLCGQCGLLDGCPEPTPFDVFFILDSSASVKVTPNRWDHVKTFTADAIDQINMAANDIRAGVIRFGSTADTSIHLADTYSRATLTALEVVGGTTDTQEALQEAIDRFDAELASRRDDPNLIVLVTDGESPDHATTASVANSARAKGVRLFGVGIDLLRTTQIQEVANDPDEFYVTTVETSANLSGLVGDLVVRMCAVAKAAKGQGAIGDPCNVHSDCADNIANTSCVSGTCQCVTSLYIYDTAILGCRLRLIGDVCTSDINCGNYMQGTCNAGACGCASGFAIITGANLCQNCALQAVCDPRADCSTVVINSRCHSNELACISTWVEKDPLTCEQRLLTVHACSTDSDCDITNSECSSGTCMCKASYKESANLRQCETITIGDNCTTDEDCAQILPPGSCLSPNKTCTCKAGYIDNPGSRFCIARKLGGVCEVDSDCSVTSHAKCISRLCTCGTGYLTTSDGASCRSRILLDDTCMSDVDCSYGIPNSFCVTGLCTNTSCVGVCVCKEGFHTDQSENRCHLVQIGVSKCDNQTDCLVGVDHSECRDGLCECLTGYHKEPSLRNCSRLLLGSPCEVTENCSIAVPNSDCGDSTCMCNYGWTKKSPDTCKMVILSEGPCDINETCADVIANSTCVSGLCLCEEGFKEVNSTYCGLVVGLVVGILLLALGGAGVGLYIKRPWLRIADGPPADAAERTDRLIRAVEELDPDGVVGSGGGEVYGHAPANIHLQVT